jgi:hypothetical protein
VSPTRFLLTLSALFCSVRLNPYQASLLAPSSTCTGKLLAFATRIVANFFPRASSLVISSNSLCHSNFLPARVPYSVLIRSSLAPSANPAQFRYSRVNFFVGCTWPRVQICATSCVTTTLFKTGLNWRGAIPRFVDSPFWAWTAMLSPICFPWGDLECYLVYA